MVQWLGIVCRIRRQFGDSRGRDASSVGLTAVLAKERDCIWTRGTCGRILCTQKFSVTPQVFVAISICLFAFKDNILLCFQTKREKNSFRFRQIQEYIQLKQYIELIVCYLTILSLLFIYIYINKFCCFMGSHNTKILFALRCTLFWVL